MVEARLGINNEFPLETLEKKQANVVCADISRYISTFLRMSEALSLPKEILEKAQFHCYRIIAIQCYKKKGFRYTQGYDRYIMICYLLSMCFCQQTGLSSSFAEASAFNLSSSLIEMANVPSLLESPPVTEKHFQKMDEEIFKLCPSTAKILHSSGHQSIYFALRWEILMFADEHDIDEILLLWDQIIYRKNRFQEFKFALCLAHIIQVPLANSNEIMVEKIQNFRDWDHHKLILDALSFLKKPNILMRRQTHIAIVLLVLMLIIYFINGFFKK